MGILSAANGSNVCLAAHRTYINDCLGREATFMISTVYAGHENLWHLQRVGDLDQKRYMLALKNSKCIVDKVN